MLTKLIKAIRNFFNPKVKQQIPQSEIDQITIPELNQGSSINVEAPNLQDLLLKKFKEDLNKLNTSNEAIELIKEREGLYLDPYKCSAGVPTIGYGTTYYPDGSKVKMNDPSISEMQALYFLKHEIMEKEKEIETFFYKNNIQFNCNEFSALVSFVYNLGAGPVVNKSKSMSKAILSRNKLRIADTFLIYNKARVGIFKRLKALRGLTIRREKERALFLKPIN
ncbi:lysozyme [Halobacteriovorax sp. GB3]|uniref:lysozyme n=1 Tax=Halobacteriovorax sp. GB3 TaxID=2719615 RepID=UPI00235FA764|nr:lysozyme [Halobacteriovorax sp. GB3]MDD0852979.1 lysozyme [Halobacteriovorax sp. GB3]